MTLEEYKTKRDAEIDKIIGINTDSRTEQCSKCKYYHSLKHNFRRGKGFEESHACTVLLHEDGWVQEVSPDGMCEMFTERSEHER